MVLFLGFGVAPPPPPTPGIGENRLQNLFFFTEVFYLESIYKLMISKLPGFSIKDKNSHQLAFSDKELYLYFGFLFSCLDDSDSWLSWVIFQHSWLQASSRIGLYPLNPFTRHFLA